MERKNTDFLIYENNKKERKKDDAGQIVYA